MGTHSGDLRPRSGSDLVGREGDGGLTSVECVSWLTKLLTNSLHMISLAINITYLYGCMFEY